MTSVLVLPILIPLVTAVVTLAAPRVLWLQRGAGIAGSVALLAAALALLREVSVSGYLTLQPGNWPAPFGITLVADLFSALMVVLAGLMAVVVSVYALRNIDERRQAFGFFPLMHVLLMGVCGAFLTGDLFNLYVWFEVMLIASFVLLVLGGERPQLEGAVKYVTLNLVASILFLIGTGLLYGKVGSLNMADLAWKLGQEPRSDLINSSAMLFLVAFGIKAAAFPLFFWLPASYHTAPAAIAAIFSGLLTKVGVYALIRTFSLIFNGDPGFTLPLILGMAGLTMVTGVLGAVVQFDMRRLLAFHIISQIGYALMGLGLFTPLALSGAIFFIVHVSIAKAALFLVGGAVARLRGTHQLKSLGGLFRSHPGLSVLFLIGALSLAGLPPFSGFFAKLSLVRAGLEAEGYLIVTVALAVSVLTLYSMTKIWGEAFWKVAPDRDEAGAAPLGDGRIPAGMLAPIVVLVLATVLLGIAAEPVFELTHRAAAQLLEPESYIRAVLGATVPLDTP